MSKFTGKRVGVGFGIETVRGTEVAPDYRVPRTDNTFIDKFEVVNEEGSNGTLIDTSGTHIGKERGEGEIGGEAYPILLGYLLKTILGGVVTTGTGPDYSHEFTLDSTSNIHPSLTVATSNPLNDYSYPLGVGDSFSLTATSGEKVGVTISMKAKKGTTQTHTVTYTSELPFIPQDTKVYIADDVVSLDSADNICLQNITLSISKNIEDIDCLSEVEPVDFTNTNVIIEGSMELYFDSEVHRAKALDGLSQSIRIELIDTDVDMGGGVNPSLIIDLAKITYIDWSPAFTIDSIVKQTISFKAHGAIAGTDEPITATLVNTKVSY